jgi:hypothetical protein
MVVEVTYDLRWFFLFLAGFGLSIMVVAVHLGADNVPFAQAVFVRLYTMIYGELEDCTQRPVLATACGPGKRAALHATQRAPVCAPAES